MHLQLRRAPQVCRPDGSATPLAARDAALLAWLALEGATPRNRLAQLLWPDSDEVAARNSLRQRLFQLRKHLGLELVVGQAQLQLAPGLTHDLDDTACPFADQPPDIGREFNAWLAGRHDRAQAQRRQALVEQADAAERARDWPAALVVAAECLALDPLSEEAHRRLIRLHYAAGDRAAALRAYDQCERALRQELGVGPMPETQALRAQLLAAQAAPPPAPARAVPASVLRPPRMVGRAAEAAALVQGWQAGLVVAVAGEAGMGKSRLLQDFAQPRPGVLHVAARPGDAAVPFATLARLLRAVSDRQPAADRGAHSLALADAPVWPAMPASPEPGTAAQRLLQQRELAQRLHAQSAVTGVLLDDLHFADASSLEWLLALLDEEPRTLSWALAWRAAEAGSPLQTLHDALVEQARLQWLALQPLDEDALAELVDSLGLPGLDGRALAPALRQRTGGNPLFVLETLKLAWVEQATGTAPAPSHALALLPRPGSVTRLIERRLSQLSPAAMALARCAAVAGTEFSTGLASRVLGTPALLLADAWGELEAAQVLREEAFVHDLLYEATLASVPVAIARVLHAQIAAHLEDSGDVPAATLARHWLDGGQPTRALPHLEQAARSAAQALDMREAARLWLQLCDLHQAAGDTARAFAAAHQAVLALREHTTGPEAAQAIDRLAALARTPAERADAQRRRAELYLTRGDTAQATAAIDQALQALGPDGPATDRADLLNLQGVLWRRAGRMHEARQSLEAALALARQHPEAADGLAGVLNNLGLVLQAQDEHQGAIGLMQESAERQADPATRARVLNNLAISLEERGQVHLAHEQRLAAARAVAGSGGVVELMLAISLGAVSRQLCRFREALQHLDRAQALAQGQKHFRHEDLLRQQAALWIELGRVNLARESLDTASKLGGDGDGAILLDMLRARLLLSQGPGHAVEVQALLAPAERQLTAAGDRRTLRRLWLQQTRVLPPAEALALLRVQLAEPKLADNPGAALPLQVRLAQAWLALGEGALGRRAAERAADWMAAVQPLEMSPAEVWLTLAQACAACHDSAAARQAASRGMAFVQRVAQDHLDPVYREGWLLRNAVNRDLATCLASLS